MVELRAGDCIWLKTKRSENINEPEGHWFVILFDPDIHGMTAIVPINSCVDNYDPTVCLYNGDHSFIIRDSYVNYSMSQMAKVEVIDQRIQQGIARVHTSRFDDELFNKILGGVIVSRNTSAPVVTEYWRRLHKKD